MWRKLLYRTYYDWRLRMRSRCQEMTTYVTVLVVVAVCITLITYKMYVDLEDGSDVIRRDYVGWRQETLGLRGAVRRLVRYRDTEGRGTPDSDGPQGNSASAIRSLSPAPVMYRPEDVGMATIRSSVVDKVAVRRAVKLHGRDWRRVLTMATSGSHSFNHTASDLIGNMDRKLDDTRLPACQSKTYDVTNLPSTSVIIIFHNEARSTLLRTVHSVIARTPSNLLKEIILVDDASTLPWLLEPLEDYIAHVDKVTLVRIARREGLIRARLRGALQARGEVLFFLDAHSEPNTMWLEPLLTRIKQNRKDPTAPIPSPTMVGCAHAIDRQYFFESGAYDPNFEIWGGENLEHAFRLWMCGGRVEVIPCSKVGHVFKPKLPYKFPGNSFSVIQRNYIRTAEVWMDDRKHIFYATQSELDPIDPTSISNRVALRQRLKCRSFDWYLRNVVPELPVPQMTAVQFGDLRVKGTENCAHMDVTNSRMVVENCGVQEIEDQHFWVDKFGTFRWKEKVIVPNNDSSLTLVERDTASPPSRWTQTRQALVRHLQSGLCLALNHTANMMHLVKCDVRNRLQRWEFTYVFNFTRKLSLLETVAKVTEVPKDSTHFGYLRNKGSRTCLNIWHNAEYEMMSCARQPKVQQILNLSDEGYLKFKDLCFHVSPRSDLMLSPCQPRHRIWYYSPEELQLRPVGSPHCLQYNPVISDKLQFKLCDQKTPYQKWLFGRKIKHM